MTSRSFVLTLVLGASFLQAPRGAHAQDLLVSSRFSNAVLRYDGTTGAFKSVFASGNGLANPNGIAYGPGGDLFVGLGDAGVVQRYDGQTGAFLGRFVFDDPATAVDETGGLPGCRAIAFGPDGDLYVTAGSADANGRVLRYDGTTGAFRGVFAQGSGMSGPVGLTFGPDGNLYVGAALSRGVWVYEGGTGRFLRTCSCAGFTNVTGVLFGPDGGLYAATSVENTVLKLSASCTCAGAFATGGGLSIPIGMAFAPDGSLLVGSFQTNSVLRYDGATGRFLGTFVSPGAGGLNGTHNLVFMPPAPSAVRSVVPIVLDVRGQFGSHFTTELTLSNRGTTAATADLSYTAATALGATGSGIVSVTLPAGRQLVIEDAIDYLRKAGLAIPASGNQGGTLRAEFRGLSAPEAGFAGARTTSPSASGRAGLSYGGVPLAEALTGRGYIFGLRQNTADRTNLALVNAGASPAVLRVTLFGGPGTGLPVALPDVTLGPGQWRSLDGVLSSTSFVAGFAAVDLVSGPGPFAAYAVFNDNANNDGSYVTAVAATEPAEEQVLPVLVETNTFSSELVLANASDQAASVRLRYVESLDPRPAAGEATVTLQPFEQKIVPGAIAYLRGLGIPIGPPGHASYAGALRVAFSHDGVAAFGFAGARTAAPGGGGRYGLFYGARGLSRLAEADAWLFGLQANGATRSNVAVVNAGDAGAVAVRFDAFDGETGLFAGSSETRTLEAGTWYQLGGLLSTFGVRSGYVRAVRVSGSSRLLPYGVVNDGATPDSGATNDGSYVAFVPGSPAAPAPPGTIGAAGGTVESAGGGASLVVPPGALETPVALTIRPSSPAPLDANLDAASYHVVEPLTTRFALPARLTLSYRKANLPAGVDENRLRVAGRTGDSWVEAASGAADAASSSASGSISGGGAYGVRRGRSTTPCAGAEHRQLDFWLGNWRFSAPGSFPGTDDVTRDEQGCVIEEAFADTNGAIGRSVSFFDPATSKWYQTYIDNFGGRLVFSGVLEGSRMVLYDSPTSRSSWEARDANHVRYFAENSTDGGLTWHVGFDGLYTRR